MAIKEKFNVAIEIGSFSFKVAAVRKSAAKVSIEYFKAVNISAVAPEQRLNYIIDFLEKELPHRVLSARHICLNFCDPSLQVKIIELPVMPKKELHPAIALHLNSKFNIDPSFIFDYEINGQKEDSQGNKKIEIVCAAVRREALDRSCDVLTKKGFVIDAVNVTAFSYIAVLKELGLGREEPAAIVDIGYNSTDFIVYSEHKIKFIRKLLIGSKQFSEGIKEKMQLQKGSSFPEEEAELLKEKYGVPMEDFVDKKYNLVSSQLLSMLRPCLDQFVGELGRSIEYFQETTKKGSNINNIFIAGGGARLKNLDIFLSQKLNIPVKYIDVPPKMAGACKQKQELVDSFPVIASVAGLALDLDAKVKLLSSKYRVGKQEALVRRYIRLLGVIFIASLGLAISDVDYRMGTLERRLKLASIDRGALEDLRVISQRVAIRNRLEDQIVKARPPFHWYLKEISRVTPDKIILEKVELNSRNSNCNIEGLVFAQEEGAASEITDFMAKLKDSDFFASADLVSTSRITRDNMTAYKFSIKCRIEQ